MVSGAVSDEDTSAKHLWGSLHPNKVTDEVAVASKPVNSPGERDITKLSAVGDQPFARQSNTRAHIASLPEPALSDSEVVPCDPRCIHSALSINGGVVGLHLPRPRECLRGAVRHVQVSAHSTFSFVSRASATQPLSSSLIVSDRAAPVSKSRFRPCRVPPCIKGVRQRQLAF